jgi:hypothetical protein
MKIKRILAIVPILALMGCRYPAGHTEAVCTPETFVSLDSLVGDLYIHGKSTQLHTLPAVLKKDTESIYELQTMNGNTRFTACRIGNQTILDILPSSSGDSYLLGYLYKDKSSDAKYNKYILAMGVLKDADANRIVNNSNLTPESVLEQLTPEFNNYGLNIKILKK